MIVVITYPCSVEIDWNEWRWNCEVIDKRVKLQHEPELVACSNELKKLEMLVFVSKIKLKHLLSLAVRQKCLEKFGDFSATHLVDPDSGRVRSPV